MTCVRQTLSGSHRISYSQPTRGRNGGHPPIFTAAAIPPTAAMNLYRCLSQNLKEKKKLGSNFEIENLLPKNGFYEL